MINLELTEEQAKMLLIVTGQMADPFCSRGVFVKLLELLEVDVSTVPNPYIVDSLIFVSDIMINKIKLNKGN